jgi:ribonuclease P/MRP protein subunit POP5
MKRIKRRYLALQLEIDGVPNEREIIDSIWIAVTKLFGEVGASLTGLSLLKFDVERKIVVVRTSLASLLFVRASIATITSIAGKDASVSVLAISGTLRALYDNID